MAETGDAVLSNYAIEIDGTSVNVYGMIVGSYEKLYSYTEENIVDFESGFFELLILMT